MSYVGPIAVGADVFWSGAQSVSAVWDDLQPAGQMTLKRWLEAAGLERWTTVCGGALLERPIISSGRSWAVVVVVDDDDDGDDDDDDDKN
ncbi:jg26324 [Pararge aegeria aegeria]|uniref:Jg26324 protein n=1 Tax=Pararge aegeria aegeria TaxID=348720 RepID=A0A8S4R6N1_9NEOP|nr:jg26324 [Pararge aegeria aegeria]